MEFAGKTALVTGAAGSIGQGIAARLIQQGASVFVTDLDQRTLDQLCTEWGDRCCGQAADVTQADQVQQVVRSAAERFQHRIDVLVNVAGAVGVGGPIEEMDPQNWEQVFAVNCRGTFLFTRYVVPLMKQQGGGSIVNFSSKSGKTGSALMTAYSAAKAAIIGLTQALAYELASHRIRVNCVCPGITENTGVWDNVSSDYVRNMNLPIDQVVKQFTSKVPLGRLARVQDIVNVTCFLASDRADYMTGQAINITGGREMH
jgi:NAD(P)-dependent dehydrogenase (short-subunit alcohol dehydrogenase family)